MKIKIILVFLFSLFLVGCGNTDSQNQSLIHFENENFSIDIPNSWKQLSIREAGITNSSDTEIELIASGENERFGVANSILIISEEKKSGENLQKYSERLFHDNFKSLYSAKKIEGGTIEFKNEQKGTLGIYEIQYSQKTNPAKYIIATNECNNIFYVLNVAIEPSVTDYSRYIEFLKSFNCK